MLINLENSIIVVNSDNYHTCVDTVCIYFYRYIDIIQNPSCKSSTGMILANDDLYLINQADIRENPISSKFGTVINTIKST